MISYEGSKWYIKLWRGRWYFYTTFLYLLLYLNIYIIIDLLLTGAVDELEYEKLRKEWEMKKKHIELTKMHKYSSK